MNVLYISGSPRKKSNTDDLLRETLSGTGGEFIKITDYRVEPCRSSWSCLKSGKCAIDDDMSQTLIPMLLKADIMVLGTPVYFNNVSAQLKAFMDRTWCIKGKLRNKKLAAPLWWDEGTAPMAPLRRFMPFSSSTK